MYRGSGSKFDIVDPVDPRDGDSAAHHTVFGPQPLRDPLAPQRAVGENRRNQNCRGNE